MANKKAEFYMHVKMLLEKSQVKEETKELQDLLSNTKLDLDSKAFEDKVRKIVGKMQRETLEVVGKSFNEAFKMLGANPIDIEKLIQMPDAKMWEEMGKNAGELYARGLTTAINKAVKRVSNANPKSFMKEIDAISQAAGRLTKKDGGIKKAAVTDLKKQYDYKVKVKDEHLLYDDMVGVQEEYKTAKTWEEQYVALLKYKKLYDAFMVQVGKVPEQFQRIDQYSYQQIEEAFSRIQASLQNVLNYLHVDEAGLHGRLIGLTEGGTVDINVVPTVGDTLDVYDLLGQKEPIKVFVKPVVEPAAKSEISESFKKDLLQLKEKYDATFSSGRADDTAEKEYEAMEEKIVNSFSQNLQEKARVQIRDFVTLDKVTNKHLNRMWELFSSAERRAEAEKIITEELEKQLLIATKKSANDDAKEQMNLIGDGGVLSSVQGADYEVDIHTLVNQLVSNIKKSVTMSLHDHPNNIDAFTPADIESYAKLYYGQGSKINGIIANGIIKTIDFSGISQEMAIKISQSFSANLAKMVSKSDYLTFENGNIKFSPEAEALAQSNPRQYTEMLNTVVYNINESLDQAFTDNGLESTVTDFYPQHLSELAQHLLGLQESSQCAIAPVEKLKNLFTSLNPSQNFNWDEYDDILKQFDLGTIDGVDAINQINARHNQKLNHQNDTLFTTRTDDVQPDKIQDTVSLQQNLNEEVKEEVLTLEQVKSLLAECEQSTENSLADIAQKKQAELSQQLEKEVEEFKALRKLVYGDTDANISDDIGQDSSIEDNTKKITEITQAARTADTAVEELNDSLKELDSQKPTQHEVGGQEPSTPTESMVEQITDDIQEEKPQTPVDVTVNPQDVAKATQQIEDIANQQPPEVSMDVQTPESDIKPSDEPEPQQPQKDTSKTKAQAIERLTQKYKELGALEAEVEAGLVKGDSEKTNIGRIEERLKLDRERLKLTNEQIEALEKERKLEHDTMAQAIASGQTDTRAKELEKLYKQAEELGIVQARVDDENYTARVKNPDILQQEIDKKIESLNLSEEELAVLKEKQKARYDSEAQLLRTQQQKKDDKQDWMKRVKTAQAATGVKAADSTINSANNVVISAIGTQGLTQDIAMKAKELDTQIRALEQLRNTINEKEGEVTEQDKLQLSQQISLVKTLKDEMNDYLAIHNKYSGDNATEIGNDISGFNGLSLEDYQNKLIGLVQATTTGKVTIKGFDNDTRELTYTVQTGANEFVNYSAAVDKVSGKIVTLQGQTVKTKGFFASIGRKMKELSAYFTGSSLIYGAVNQLKQGIQYVKEIDSALTELKKVTNETEESYEKFLNTAAKTGAKIGSTISEFTEATATFAKLGYDINMASEMAEAAIVYTNVGDDIASAEAAAESIVSTMKGFGLEASESMAIVDRFNEVNYPASLYSNVYVKSA